MVPLQKLLKFPPLSRQQLQFRASFSHVHGHRDVPLAREIDQLPQKLRMNAVRCMWRETGSPLNPAGGWYTNVNLRSSKMCFGGRHKFGNSAWGESQQLTEGDRQGALAGKSRRMPGGIHNVSDNGRSRRQHLRRPLLPRGP